MEEAEGYDMVNTMFTPEGRLRQVEYASKTAKKGSTVIALQCTDGVLIVDYRRDHGPLRVTRVEQKIEIIDDHMAVGMSGIISDGTVLLEELQLDAAHHRMSYGTPYDLKEAVLSVSSVLQSYTQFSGMRPFGVSMVVAGIDQEGASVYALEPSGTFHRYTAVAIGENDEAVKEVLRAKHSTDMNLEAGLAVIVSALRTTNQKDFTAERVQGRILKKGAKKFELIDDKAVKKAFKASSTKK